MCVTSEICADTHQCVSDVVGPVKTSPQFIHIIYQISDITRTASQSVCISSALSSCVCVRKRERGILAASLQHSSTDARIKSDFDPTSGKTIRFLRFSTQNPISAFQFDAIRFYRIWRKAKNSSKSSSRNSFHPVTLRCYGYLPNRLKSDQNVSE